jgi:hypothetical protein
MSWSPTKPRTKQQLAGQFAGKDLDDYAEEKAGLLDLLHDSKWFLQGQPLAIEVDFHAVEQAELTSAQEPFPRRTRNAATGDTT